LRTITCILFLLLGALELNAQSDESWSIGASAIYDFQSNGIGIGARAYFPLTERFAVSPQVAYFPPFNSIHELYAGASLQFAFLFFQEWHMYLLGSGYYNRWFNARDYSGTAAKPNNFAPEGGLGIMKTYGCLKPFAEGRYDTKWKEFHVQLGILLSFGDCFIPSGRDRCPAY
jgi:hypothetical protein